MMLLNPFRFGGGTPPIVVGVLDADFANVVLLMHMEGADASTTFPDSSLLTKLVTASGGAQVDTAQFKFGAASALFDGVTDYLTTADSNDFAFGTGNFTIEFFIRIGAATAFDTVIGQMASSANLWKIDLGSTGRRLRFTATSSSTIIAEYVSNADVLTVGIWHHVAVVRNGTSVLLFVDGVNVATTANTGISTTSMPNVAAALVIGYDALNSGRDINGHLDDLRITVNTARYTTGFTAPTVTFPDSIYETVDFPTWPDDQVSNPDFDAAFTALIEANRDAGGLASGAKIDLTDSYPGTNSNSYAAGIMLPDGRLYLAPHTAVNAKIFNPVTLALTTPSGTFNLAGGWNGAVLMADGRVFVVPHNSTTARIYDPGTNALSTPTGTYPGTFAYTGGVLLPDGRVLMVPHTATVAAVYDPVADSVATYGTFGGNYEYAGAVLLKDGRVFLVPHNATDGMIFDPATNGFTTSGTFPGSEGFVGGALLEDGRVFCAPHKSATARIWDPSDGSVSTPSGTYGSAGTANFCGCATLPDGRVFIAPFQSTSARIYDPYLDTLSTPSGTYSGAGACHDAAVMPNGNTFCVPYNSSIASIARTGYGLLDVDYYTSPFFNRF